MSLIIRIKMYKTEFVLKQALVGSIRQCNYARILSSVRTSSVPPAEAGVAVERGCGSIKLNSFMFGHSKKMEST